MFNGAVLRAFEGGWQASLTVKRPARDLLRLALVGAAMDACNAAADGKCLRYKSDWSVRPRGLLDFTAQLTERVRAIVEDLKSDPLPESSAQIMVGDARQTLRTLREEKFRLCVTSPPYLNSFDYTDVNRPQLFLSKLVSSSEELRALRRATIRSHVQTKWAQPIRNSFGAVYAHTMTRMNAVLDQVGQKVARDDSGVL